MEKLNFDERTEREILKQMEQKALSYVPEWRFDRENPDIGTALAMVYGQMLSGTVKKLNYLPYKNQISFFNQLEAELLPAVPSKGYITFSLVNDKVSGEEVPAGMEVLAQAKTADMETVSFETLDDIYVTPASLTCMLQVSSEKDFIGNLYDREESQKEILLFSYDKQNLQEHTLYFCQKDVLSIKKEGQITITFELQEGEIPDDHIDGLANTDYAVFEYSTEQGYQIFPKVEKRGKQLVLSLEQDNLPFAKTEENGWDNFWIRCRVKEVNQFRKFSFHKLLVASSCSRMIPENIYANGAEVKKDIFFPFGESFSNYNEVYFSSDEVFGKKGSVVTMTFNVDFLKVPLDYPVDHSMEWQWVMKRSDFKPDLEYDVTIEEVVWEYFNGNGWAALFDKNEYGDIFSVHNGTIGQYKKMSFVCPNDMETILINAHESFYIRARITKVNNLYKMKGNYISPMIGNIFIQYQYDTRPVEPEIMLTENNRERKQYCYHSGEISPNIIPFYGLEEEVQTLYLGFDVAPIGGPIKILFDFPDKLNQKDKKLFWEYYNGEKWKGLDMVDETDNMSRTGIVTLMGNRDFCKKILYGYEKYWIKISDVSGSREKDKNQQPFCLAGMYMNSVKIRQKEREQIEYFHMETYQKNMKFRLLYGKISESNVYVDEIGRLSKKELSDLLKKHKLYPEYRDNGEFERAWVKWEQVEDFLDSGSEDRHYILNRNKGYIQFGNGRAGKIPPTGKIDNIKVMYETGGGEFTNVPAGAIIQLGKYVGFINEVCNYKMLTGGSDAETLEEALDRNAAMLRHQNMAITTRDFEEIAKTASRSIKKVKCFSGYDEKENRQSGAITLVVLQKEFGQGRASFNDLKMEVENYMKDKMNTCLWDMKRFFVIEPKFVELRIRTEVKVNHFDEVFHVKKRILERLDNFINPLTGNFDGAGWAIGTLPNSFQLRNAISDIPGIAYIKKVYISTFCSENSTISEVDLEEVKKSKYVLPISGEHDIIIKVS